MKLILALMLVIPLMFSSCSEDLADMNWNPNASSTIPYNAEFLHVLANVHGISGQFTMAFYATASQQLAAVTLGQAYGDKYTIAADNPGDGLYNPNYTGPIKAVVNLIERTKGDPELSNYYNIARIMKVYAFAWLTDTWGDTPYSEAARGYLDLNFTPVYDTQESIYMDFFKELSEAIPALDPAKVTYDGSDNYYSGDIAKWKKLGYSLMARLAMRIQKVDPAKAQQYFNTAIAGGVIASNADNQIFHHQSGSSHNAINSSMESNFNRFRVSKYLVDVLKNTSDPRLTIFAEPFDAASFNQIEGIPNGLDETNMGFPANNPLGLDWNEWAYFNRTILNEKGAPAIGLNYSEMCFLKAEAVLRGWITGDATALYNEGVKASMEQWGIYTGIVVPTSGQINAYLAANPFDGSYKMIGEQMYLTFWRDFKEVWINWKRSGYPVLTPVNYPGNVTGGTIPRRIPYNNHGCRTNVEENRANYEAAVARQGPDEFTTRVWWDVP